MKRPLQDVAGGPRRSVRRTDVAGRPIRDSFFTPRLPSRDPSDPLATAMDDGMLLEDFVEFLSDRDDEAGAVSHVDADFQARLRSRLWRSFVLARLHDGDEVH